MYNFSYVFNITGIYTASNPSASSTDTSLQIKMLGALKKIGIKESLLLVFTTQLH